MREIKFRVWCNDAPGMYYGGFSIHASAGKMIVSSATPWIKETDPVMQFAGLTDKNGKEIYEGDIAKRYSRIGCIKYGLFTDMDGEYYPTVLGVYLEIDEEVDGYSPVQYSLPIDDFEVIGNIHENPELLNETNLQAIQR